LFRHLLLQIGGANIENPPPSSSPAEERRRSLLIRAAARDSRVQVVRFAQRGSRCEPAYFVVARRR
jgi:hypothetical protein